MTQESLAIIDAQTQAINVIKQTLVKTIIQTVSPFFTDGLHGKCWYPKKITEKTYWIENGLDEKIGFCGVYENFLVLRAKFIGIEYVPFNNLSVEQLLLISHWIVSNFDEVNSEMERAKKQKVEV